MQPGVCPWDCLLGGVWGGETAGCGSTVKMLNLQGCLFLGQAETGAYTLGATSELLANQNWEICQDQKNIFIPKLVSPSSSPRSCDV